MGNVNEARQLATNGIRFSPSPSYLLHLHERNKMNEKQLKEAMEATPEWSERQRAIHAHEKVCEKQWTLENMAKELSKVGADLWAERLKANDALFATREHKAYWKLWKEDN